MAERMKETFNPVYNNVEQVKKCAGFMLGEEVTNARIAIVIGHNGRDFVSSTDWRLTTASGVKRILPFSIRPQYPNFVECVAGVEYTGQNSAFCVVPDKTEAKRAMVFIGDDSYLFEPGAALKIYVSPESEFIATDCTVVCEENAEENIRIYRVMANEQTLYGRLDNQGYISQV